MATTKISASLLCENQDGSVWKGDAIWQNIWTQSSEENYLFHDIDETVFNFETEDTLTEPCA